MTPGKVTTALKMKIDSDETVVVRMENKLPGGSNGMQLERDLERGIRLMLDAFFLGLWPPGAETMSFWGRPGRGGSEAAVRETRILDHQKRRALTR